MHLGALLPAALSPSSWPVATSLLERLMSASGPESLGLLVLLLVVGVVGVPVPEEAVFATSGWLAFEGRVPLWAAFLAAWGTVAVLDIVVYEVGRRLGPGVRRSRWGRRVPRRRWASLRLTMRRRGVVAVGLARFVMGLRVPTFLLAGAARMPRTRFVPTVALLGLVSGAIPFTLGYVFADHLVGVIDGLAYARWVLLGVALSIAAALIGLAMTHRRRRGSHG